MSPHDRLLLLIDNLRGNREFRLVDADLSALIDIDARITWLEAENARLRERLDAFTKAFRENAVDEGDCFVCGWPINEFQRQHGEKCVIAAALQGGSDD